MKIPAVLHFPNGLMDTLAQNQYLRLETTGRKSGKARQVLLRYISSGTKIIVFPGRSGVQSWFLNLQSNPRAKVFFQDRVFNCLAETKKISGLDDPLIGVFTRKYGRDLVNQYYKGQHYYAELSVGEGSEENLDEVIYGDLEAAFDGVAQDYDRHIFGNPINTWLRTVSLAVMSQVFKPGETVLEIGCGTGTETLSLARQGVRVIATDISSKMIDALGSKVKNAGLSDKVICIWSKPVELKEKISALGLGKLDGAYSTYGAVNTEPNLGEMFALLNDLLKEDAPLVLGVWNKYCLSEILGYSLKLKPSLAFARFRNPVQVGRSRFCVATNAFSIKSLGAIVSPYFELIKVYGVVVALPPSNLTRYLPGQRMFKFLKSFDLNAGRSFPLNRLGDHFIGIYRRKKAP